ncbi:short chain dehydrogenase reductase [Phlyctema vagabunda]|uniref:Short chain dehydrogenase reductase n=1 Tax=Phlyctema vagabunda TaxID=108571 RepID=A0ABR4PED5_9HELO
MAIPANSGYNFTNQLHNDIYAAINPTKSELSQPSKVVLITGAGRGIGRSIALRYAESGVACLILCARTMSQLEATEKDIEAINPDVRVRVFAIDVTDEQNVVSLAQTVREEEGRLDILVNNAGNSPPWAPIAETRVESYWQTFELNLKGIYLMLKSLLPLLAETVKKENIAVDVVNLTSIGANVLLPGASAYGVSKLAVSRLTEFVKLEYGEQGVNCFAVHPGGVPTELSNGIAPPELLTDTPDLAGGFVVWLTKGQRTWLSGRYVSATWDVAELLTMEDEIVAGEKLKVRMIV